MKEFRKRVAIKGLESGKWVMLDQKDNKSSYEILLIKDTVWFIISLFEILLALRFFSILFQARIIPSVSYLISITDSLIEPFRGIFYLTSLEFQVDISAFVAMVMYLVIGWIITALLDLLLRKR